MKNTEVMFSLFANVLSGKAVDEQVKISAQENAEAVYKIAKYHDLAHLMSYAIENNGIEIPNEALRKEIKKRLKVSVVRYEQLNYDYNRMLETFEKNKIQYIPLKGSVIRDLYPEPWMRTSCDIDVLVHEEDLEKASKVLTEDLGCEQKESGTHDVSFFTPNGTHIELHFKLSEVLYDFDAGNILDNVWEYSCLKDGFEYQYVMRDDVFYMFHIYHMAKHFEVGGCGIRPLVDLYLLDSKLEYDAKAREKMLEQAKLSMFASYCRKLYNFWFFDGESDELILKFQHYVFTGGVYGNVLNRQNFKSAKNKDSKIGYILGRIFLPYDKLAVQFPIIKKHKWLTPFCEVLRWFKLFDPKCRRIAKLDFDVTKSKSTGESDLMVELLEQIGLKNK